MKDYTKQKGGSLIFTIIFLGMASVILTVSFKLYPAFYEHWQIQGIVHSFEEESNLETLSSDAIITLFEKRLITNNVQNFDMKESLIVEADSEGVYIGVDYEVQVPLYQNIDALLKFEDHYEKSF